MGTLFLWWGSRARVGTSPRRPGYPTICCLGLFLFAYRNEASAVTDQTDLWKVSDSSYRVPVLGPGGSM